MSGLQFHDLYDIIFNTTDSIENDTTLVSFESCNSMTAVCLGVLQNCIFSCIAIILD